MSEQHINNANTTPKAPARPAVLLSLFTLTIFYFFILAKAPGLSDLLFVILWATTMATIFYQVLKIKNGLRRAMKHIFDSNSLAYKFFDKKSILQLIISLLLGFLVSLSFLVTLKLLTLKHGLFPTLFVLLIPAIFLYISKDSKFTSSLGENMKDIETQEIVAHTSELLIKAVFIAFCIAFIFSTLDTLNFYNSDVGFFNFAEKAYDQSIKLGSGGHYARSIINFVVILDNFTLAATNELIKALGYEKTTITPVLFLAISFVINLLKLIPFCIAYVFIILSLKTKPVDFALSLHSKGTALIKRNSKKHTANNTQENNTTTTDTSSSVLKEENQ